MNRALRAATLGVALISPIALGACGAGQVTQTAQQERDHVGTTAEVGDITVRAATLAYPTGGSYDAGDDAALQLAIVNSAEVPDALTDISGPGFDDYEIDPETTSASTSATSTAAPEVTEGELEIPANSVVYLSEDGTDVTLVGLDDALTTGQYVDLVLTFEEAGEVELSLPVAGPERSLQRGEGFDFHEEEHAGEEGVE